jgi:hypothetical protein
MDLVTVSRDNDLGGAQRKGGSIEDEVKCIWEVQVAGEWPCQSVRS